MEYLFIAGAISLGPFIIKMIDRSYSVMKQTTMGRDISSLLNAEVK